MRCGAFARSRLLLAGRVGVSGMLAAACYCFDVGVLKVLGEKFDHLRRGTVEHDRHGQQSNEGVLQSWRAAPYLGFSDR